MRFRQLAEVQQARDSTEYFYGYNHNPKISDSEFYDMYNMSTDKTPISKSIGKIRRISVTGDVKFNNFIEINDHSCCYVKDLLFVYVMDNGEGHSEYDTLLLQDIEDPSKRKLIYSSNQIYIFPDSIIVKDLGSRWSEGSKNRLFKAQRMDHRNTAPVNLQAFMCDRDGKKCVFRWRQATEPTSNRQNGDYWLDTSVPEKERVPKKWNSKTNSWDSAAFSYIMLLCMNDSDEFREFKTGMNLRMSMIGSISYVSDNTTYPFDILDAKNTMPDGLRYNESLPTIVKTGRDGMYDYIVFPGQMYDNYNLITVFFDSNIPEFDYVTESENRLWGCVSDSNQIYASRLGQFDTFESYDGTTLDSYTVTVGGGGKFTCAVTYQGKPVFFKEDCMYKVYGNYPSNYQVQTSKCDGVKEGMHNTAQVTDGSLFYVACCGVMRYDGSIPTKISDKLGDLPMNSANPSVSASHSGKYYVTINNGRSIYVFDARKGFWSIINIGEDVIGLFSLPTNVYASTNYKAYALLGGHINDVIISTEEYVLPWMVETGELSVYQKSGGSLMECKKYISQVIVRMKSEESVYFYIEYDSSGEWEHIYTSEEGNLRTLTIPLRPRRCDHFRLKMTGVGDAEIYSIVKYIEQGSER